MPGIILTFPIVAGKVEAWRRFCQELAGARRQSYEASRKRLVITREQMTLVENSFGAMSVTTLESPDVGWALDQIISSERPFDRWYRKQMQEFYGIKLNKYDQFGQLPPMPLNQEVCFEWILNPGISN